MEGDRRDKCPHSPSPQSHVLIPHEPREASGAEAVCKEMQTVGEDRRLLENGQSMLCPPSLPTVNRENPAPSTKLSANPGTMVNSPAKVAGIIYMVRWVPTILLLSRELRSRRACLMSIPAGTEGKGLQQAPLVPASYPMLY